MNPNETNKDNHELYFEMIASQYTELDGELLKNELDTLKEQKKYQDTRKLDQTVFSYVNKKKRERIIRNVWKSAACFALFIGLALVINFTKFTPTQETSPPEMAAEESSPFISLATSLPENFHISKVKEDLGETIYYLENTTMDDVVLSVKKSTFIETSGLKEITLHDTTVYGANLNDYNILVFHLGELSYTLTCKYEIKTLLNLSEQIILDFM